MRLLIFNPVLILTVVAPLILGYFYLTGEVDPNFERLGRALQVAMINSLTIFTAAWFFSSTGFLKILFLDSNSKPTQDKTSTPLIILFFCLVYLLNLQLLQLLVAQHDQTVLDRGYIVILIATLFLSRERSIIICGIALAIRLGFYFYTEQLYIWGFSKYQLQSYQWMLFYPGIVALVAAFLTGTLCRLYFQNKKMETIPAWIGFTLAILIEPIYLGALLNQTDANYIIKVIGSETVPNMMALGGTITVLLYMLHGLHADLDRTHAKKAELALLQENLRYLRVQMNPHFLFNTLNTISHFISEKPAYAKELLLDFSDMFRHVVHDETLLVPFTKEVEFIKMYISLEQARLGNRLQVEYEITATALSWEIPTLMLQPFIENSIKHGFSEQHQQIQIKLTARIQDKRLIIDITDNGRGMHNITQPSKKTGISLINIRQRLALIYDQDAKLKIHSPSANGTHISLIIPATHSLQFTMTRDSNNA